MNTNNKAKDNLLEMQVLMDLAERQRRIEKMFLVLRQGFVCGKDCKFCGGSGVASYHFVPPQRMGDKIVQGYYRMEKCRNAVVVEIDRELLWKRLDGFEEQLRGVYETLFRFTFWGGLYWVMMNVWERVKSIPLAPSRRVESSTKGRGRNDAFANTEGGGMNGADGPGKDLEFEPDETKKEGV